MPMAKWPSRRPVSRLDTNPLVDQHETNGETVPEFTQAEIIQLRRTFRATQRRFAQMFGISIETVRNWEQGKRKPQGPARALLRVARANPEAVARTLWRYRRAWWMD